MKILVVEDDQIIREGVCEFLSELSYDVDGACDGREALDKFSNNSYNLLILDIQIPFINGLKVLEEIRKTSRIPVLILTAFNDEDYKISAFTNLCDGYMEKPFSLSLLKLRVESLLKRHYGDREIFEYKDAKINFSSYKASYLGENIDMNAKELEILKFLLENEGLALSRMQIIENVWKESDEIPYDRVIDVYIKQLRKKLGLDCIKTIRNVGYKLELKWKN